MRDHRFRVPHTDVRAGILHVDEQAPRTIGWFPSDIEQFKCTACPAGALQKLVVFPRSELSRIQEHRYLGHISFRETPEDLNRHNH